MKIGIMSDTHHNLKAIEEAVCMAPDVLCWLHAGDNISDTDYLAHISEKPVYGILGNTDFPSQGENNMLVELPGCRVFITHGHLYNVNRNLDSLVEVAKDYTPDLVVYGHTHKGLIKQFEDFLVVNPGSLAQPRDGLDPSFMVANIVNKKIKIERFYIEKSLYF